MNVLSPLPSLPVEPGNEGVPSIIQAKPLSWLIRGTWLFTGVVLPFFCFSISYPEGPRWQSGGWDAYAQLLLSREASFAQYPFLFYSMTCMGLLTLQPARFWNSPFVRFGIFTGVLVAAEYWLTFQVASSGSTHIALLVTLSAVAVFVPWIIWRILGFLVRKLGYERAMLIGGLVALPLLAFWHVVLFICLWCSTPWALASYLTVSVYLVCGRGAPKFRFSLAQLLIAFAWLSAHLGAWRISFLVMLREYASLPTSPPAGCFVCTAVAKGHFRVVRSEEYIGPGGTVYRVNAQLRCLKAFELLLASVSPRFHRMCRWIYDRLGPKLAAAIVHPVLADLGYLALKPAEWLAIACLALAIPGEMGLIRDIYRTHRRSEAGK